VKRESLPGNLKGAERECFSSRCHLSYCIKPGTAKMAETLCGGRRGAESLWNQPPRIADGSIMPRVTPEHLAPCVSSANAPPRSPTSHTL